MNCWNKASYIFFPTSLKSKHLSLFFLTGWALPGCFSSDYRAFLSSQCFLLWSQLNESFLLHSLAWQIFFPQTSPGTDRQALWSISLMLPIASIRMGSQNSPSLVTPPRRAIWGRTSDKDHVNITFTGICTKSWFWEESKAPEWYFDWVP